MNFSDALDMLKRGTKVARSGWNGKGMWICLSPGKKNVAPEELWAGPNRAFAITRLNKGGVDVLPYITMKTADDCIVPWFASQTDILADDWEMVK